MCIDRRHGLHLFGDIGYTLRHDQSTQERAYAMEGGNRYVPGQEFVTLAQADG